MKLLTILGFRPQFIKDVTVSRAIKVRDDTELVETVEAGWNQLASVHTEQILNVWHNSIVPSKQIKNLYGDGQAADKVLNGFFL
jgi:UDP-N-acetylglucosamine 2-epimerase